MPNTIAQNLARLTQAKSDIADAITAKGGTVTSGDGFEAFPADIATIPSGGGGGDADAGKPVKFIDYDGTIVDSYTASEFAALTAMPPNPTHEGLTAQGWNWSLSDAKAYVAKYGMLNIGQMYITSDGRTRLYVRMQDGRLSPILKLYLNANSELDIDWGDGTAHSTFTSTSAGYKREQHNYASAGAYVVSIGVTSGSFVLQSSSSSTSTLFTAGKANTASADRGYLNSIEKIEIGSGVTSIRTYAFALCNSLSQITIPNSVISLESNVFYQCTALSQITIPNSVASIGDSAFALCNSLSQITIPDSVTSIKTYAFQQCYALSQITIPNSVISLESNVFYQCTALSQITIPNSVASIGDSAFRFCYSVGYIKFTSQTPPAVSSSFAWDSVPTDCKILVPRGTLAAYTSATNYPNSATYTYEEYDV